MTISALTICSLNYLARALVLAESYLLHHPDHHFSIVLVDRKDVDVLPEMPNVQFIWAEDLGIQDFWKKAFMFDVIEFNTNVKPKAMLRLLESQDAVVYLDPDIKVYAPLTPVMSALESHSVVVTPHANQPILDGKKPDDLEFLKFGSFNLGFVGVAASGEGRRFLEWWSDRCLEFGFYEPQMGLAVDQKWVQLAPCYFPNLGILHDPGLNLAFWNLHERTLSQVDEKWVVNDEFPLRFIHFSSFNSSHPENIANKQSRFAPNSREDFIAVARDYANELHGKEREYPTTRRYSFDYFTNGKPVSVTLRRAYASRLDEFGHVEQPFDTNEGVYAFAKQNGLLSRNDTPAKRKTFKDIGAESVQVKVINFLLRLALRILGPDRYFDLMRYMAHISSIRNQAEVFKVK
ncbi:Capsular polysaccharide biosynthesis protein [Ralstonia pickettii]|mgnify:CR=1 FL=1|jgi:hypothetical protein|uniref:hypothetical protein n=1 Tax=Ralstonia TaxID=48736 RepID=UPI00022BF5FA|nr:MULTISPECIES: hypothetical protein [Ralstonia]EGY62933.1 hypothetical protein HMPREF0989_03428 [Ralstonia sp. 5_2_56FAA]KFL21931.1 putative glycosyl transferase [Ralstonia pickettii]MBU6521492.1 glycosyl transferase [Ralstonia sp. B265]NPT50914.1 glycosyl transferase [Ralstonia sp. 3N]QQK34441.1 hypothetical protein RP6297_00625 [Ralstonia pickettii]